MEVLEEVLKGGERQDLFRAPGEGPKGDSCQLRVTPVMSKRVIHSRGAPMLGTYSEGTLIMKVHISHPQWCSRSEK